MIQPKDKLKNLNKRLVDVAINKLEHNKKSIMIFPTSMAKIYNEWNIGYRES